MKVFALLALVYVGIVILFESFLGYLQPQNEQTLVLSVTDDSGTVHERVLSRIELEERLYVAVNHWPRQWFQLAMEKPNVKVTYSGKRGPLGLTLILDHGYGVRTFYGHSEELLVKRGDEVERGQKIATVGNTGRSTGPHLHYAVEVDGKGRNPLDYIFD